MSQQDAQAVGKFSALTAAHKLEFLHEMGQIKILKAACC
jgi:hypothetical protein